MKNHEKGNPVEGVNVNICGVEDNEAWIMISNPIKMGLRHTL